MFDQSELQKVLSEFHLLEDFAMLVMLCSELGVAHILIT
jgi:hypothetical protein